MITLSASEVAVLSCHPDALKALANYYDFNQCEADSIGVNSGFMIKRRAELLCEINAIEHEAADYRYEQNTLRG